MRTTTRTGLMEDIQGLWAGLIKELWTDLWGSRGVNVGKSALFNKTAATDLYVLFSWCLFWNT